MKGVDLLLDLADPWAYILIFLLGLAEGAALIGLFLPGETAMVLGGVLVAQGRSTLGGMLLAGCLGSALGDSVGYWVGHRFGGALRQGFLGRKIGQERWERADTFLEGKGGRAVFFGRFLGFLRTLVPPLVGSSAMPYRRFVRFNAPAAILWAAVFILMGVAAGRSWRLVSEWSGRASLVLLILLVFGIALFVAARWVRGRAGILVAGWVALLVLSLAVAALVSKDRGWLVLGTVLLGGALFLDEAAGHLLGALGTAPPSSTGSTGGRIFPSPEVTAGSTTIGGLTYVLARLKSWSAAVFLSAILLFVLFFVALALMYLGRQTPSVIATGFLLGLLWAAISVTSSHQLSYLWRS